MSTTPQQSTYLAVLTRIRAAAASLEETMRAVESDARLPADEIAAQLQTERHTAILAIGMDLASLREMASKVNSRPRSEFPSAAAATAMRAAHDAALAEAELLLAGAHGRVHPVRKLELGHRMRPAPAAKRTPTREAA